jgi:hypothetical protein
MLGSYGFVAHGEWIAFQHNPLYNFFSSGDNTIGFSDISFLTGVP